MLLIDRGSALDCSVNCLLESGCCCYASSFDCLCNLGINYLDLFGIKCHY